MAIEQGVDKVGVVASSRLREAGLPPGYGPEDMLPGAKSLISFLVRGMDVARARLPLEPDGKNLGALEHSMQFVLLGSGWPGATHLDLISYRIARELVKRGHRALPIPSGHPYDKMKARGIICQKHAAVPAGLGEMGVNQLLMTLEYGCNVWPGAVLTDAALEEDVDFVPHLCAESRKTCSYACIKACPAGALSPEGTVDKKKCVTYLYDVPGKPYGYQYYQHEVRCARCMYACPVGRE